MNCIRDLFYEPIKFAILQIWSEQLYTLQDIFGILQRSHSSQSGKYIRLAAYTALLTRHTMVHEEWQCADTLLSSYATYLVRNFKAELAPFFLARMSDKGRCRDELVLLMEAISSEAIPLKRSILKEALNQGLDVRSAILYFLQKSIKDPVDPRRIEWALLDPNGPELALVITNRLIRTHLLSDPLNTAILEMVPTIPSQPIHPCDRTKIPTKELLYYREWMEGTRTGEGLERFRLLLKSGWILDVITPLPEEYQEDDKDRLEQLANLRSKVVSHCLQKLLLGTSGSEAIQDLCNDITDIIQINRDILTGKLALWTRDRLGEILDQLDKDSNAHQILRGAILEIH